MTTCTNCTGSGLAGSGPTPWLHQGAVVTCPVCSGKGTLPDPVVESSVSEVSAPQDTPIAPEEIPKVDGAEPSADSGTATEPLPEQESGQTAPDQAPQN